MFQVVYETLISGLWYVDHEMTETFSTLEEARRAAMAFAAEDQRAVIWQRL